MNSIRLNGNAKLGVTLRYMLTGSYEPEALEKADCPERLKRCLQKAAAFSPDDRYQCAKEFRLALTGAESGRKPRWFLPAALCAVAVISGALIWQSGKFGGRDASDSVQAPEKEQGQDVFDSVQNETDVPVVFDNALLEQAVRAELKMPEGDITEEDLARVERLAIVGYRRRRGPEAGDSEQRDEDRQIRHLCTGGDLHRRRLLPLQQRG